MKKVIFSLLLVSAFCFSSYETFAQCTCALSTDLSETFQRSDAVLVGKVIEANKIQQNSTDNSEAIIKFEVKQAWKRDSEKFVTVKLHGSTVGFEPNAEWLLYVFKDKDGTLQIFRGCCSRTKLISVANRQGDLKGLKKMGEKPKKILESNGEAEQFNGREAKTASL